MDIEDNESRVVSAVHICTSIFNLACLSLVIYLQSCFKTVNVHFILSLY